VGQGEESSSNMKNGKKSPRALFMCYKELPNQHGNILYVNLPKSSEWDVIVQFSSENPEGFVVR
jgi:hypothetical protein